MLKYNRCEDAWHDFSGRRYCNIHQVFFGLGTKCPKCYPPSFPVENKKADVGVSSSNVDRRGLSKKYKQAYDYQQKGRSLSWIANKLRSKKSTVHVWIKKYKAFIKENKPLNLLDDKPVKKSSGVRLHNDSVSFLIVPVDLSMEKTVKLKYSCYVLDKRNRDWHVQIFPSKLVVRFLKDIVADSEDEVEDLALQRIKKFLSQYSRQGVVFLDDEAVQVSRHYAIMGTDLAKKMVRDRKRVVFYCKKSGKVKGRIDDSDRLREVDFEDPLTGKSDSKRWSLILGDVSSDDPIDLLSVTKKKTDLLLEDFSESKEVLKGYMEQIKLHLKVEAKTNKVLDEMNKTLKEIRKEMRK